MCLAGAEDDLISSFCGSKTAIAPYWIDEIVYKRSAASKQKWVFMSQSGSQRLRIIEGDLTPVQIKLLELSARLNYKQMSPSWG